MNSYPTMARSIKANEMSSPTLGSPQLKITLSKLLKDGLLLGNAKDVASLSFAPDVMEKPFGKRMVISQKVFATKITRGVTLQAACRCIDCGYESRVKINTLLLGETCKACHKLNRDVPVWITRRTKGMMARCNNSAHKAYPNYGGRGVRFNFSSALVAAQWIVQNLGLRIQDRNIQLDRINNDGHYEPGNLRWASKSLNCSNTRRGGWVAKTHKFRFDHPEIRYADKTLRNLISMGLSADQIVERYYRKSDKPKGVFGTCSIADPEIASLAKDF